MDCGSLSAGQRAEYLSRGFVAVRDRFAAAECLAWQQETDRLIQVLDAGDERDPRIQARPHLAQGRILDRLDPVIDLSPVFAGLARDPRLLTPVADVLGDSPRLFKDKLIFKRPGTGGYGLHQDWPYYEDIGLPPAAIVSVLVSIDPADSGNGALELFPGRHQVRLPAPADEPRDVDPSCLDLTLGETVALSPCDLLLFHSLSPHRSGPNRSTRSRRALYLTYNSARYGDLYAHYYALKRRVAS